MGTRAKTPREDPSTRPENRGDRDGDQSRSGGRRGKDPDDSKKAKKSKKPKKKRRVELEVSDRHDWVSFDLDGYTWTFDVTFLTSRWSCIFGAGCPGVLTGPAPELVHGCCTYGAHFADREDRDRIAASIERMDAGEWELREVAEDAGGPIQKNDDGDWVTMLHDDACVFLNRVGAETGPGCALHQAAVRRGERPLDWKPAVCWQLPLRLDEHTDVNEHVTYTLREWKRRDWGPGGDEFHWWCTESPDAFVGEELVVDALADEIVELVGARPYRALVQHLEARGRVGFMAHPAIQPES